MILPGELVNIDLDIAGTMEANEYRPVVVVILLNEELDFLLVQSAKNDDWWGCVQGGVNPKESIIEALFREVEEEIGLLKEDHIPFYYYGVNQVEISGWEKRDGFKKGKRYYYFTSICYDHTKIRLDKNELSDYEWLTPEDFLKSISSLNPEKQTTIKKAVKFSLSDLSNLME